MKLSYSKSALDNLPATDILYYEKSLVSLKDIILNLYDKIKSYSHVELTKLAFERLYSLYNELDCIARFSLEEHLLTRLIEDPDILKAMPLLRSYYVGFFDLHEKYLAKNIINAADPWSVLNNFPLLPKYSELVCNHLKLLPIKKIRLYTW